ncbi:MAG: aminoacyl-tRNA hydrolase [bacterium]
MSAISCAAGLGNPGSKYRGTYHNLGFRAVDALCSSYENDLISSDNGKLYRLVDSSLDYAGKPGLYVNRSGEVLKKWAGEFEFEPGDFLVIYDDLDLKVGQVRLRPAGSAGGHNGLQNIIDCLQTDAIPRLRIGIGPLPTNATGKDFVLSPVNKDEQEIYSRIMDNVPAIVQEVAEEGISPAMDSWNGVDFSER